jgi:hypothetical protein
VVELAAAVAVIQRIPMLGEVVVAAEVVVAGAVVGFC